MMNRNPKDTLTIFEHGKIPPQATDLEEIVLGSALLDKFGAETMVRVLLPESFYKESHSIIAQAIVKLHERNEPVDSLTVVNELRKTGELDLVGGPYYISQLTNRVASSVNIEHHAKIIQEKFFQREMIRVCSELVSLSYEDTTDVFDLMDMADKNIQKVIDLSANGNDASHISDVLKKSFDELVKRELLSKEGKMSGVNTGCKELNKMTQGWQSGNLIVWASRPSMGKTAVMVKEAVECAKSGIPVCCYELEMNAVKLSDRMILAHSGIDEQKYRSGFMSESDWAIMNTTISYLSSLPIYIDDNPVVSMRYVRSHARMMQRRGKCGMVMMDYLQLADMRLDEKGRNREQEVAQASRAAKITAKTLGIPFHLFSQLSRKVEDRGGDKRPMLSDLRESGAIEQDADIVIFIHRPEYYGIMQDDQGNSTEGLMELIVSKNRDGAVGTVLQTCNKSLTKINDVNYDDTIPPNTNFNSSTPF